MFKNEFMVSTDETHEDEITNVVNIYELMKLGVFAVSFTE